MMVAGSLFFHEKTMILLVYLIIMEVFNYYGIILGSKIITGSKIALIYASTRSHFRSYISAQEWFENYNVFN